MISMYRKLIMSSVNHFDMSNIGLCSHEEADLAIRITLCMRDAAIQGWIKIAMNHEPQVAPQP